MGAGENIEGTRNATCTLLTLVCSTRSSVHNSDHNKQNPVLIKFKFSPMPTSTCLYGQLAGWNSLLVLQSM